MIPENRLKECLEISNIYLIKLAKIIEQDIMKDPINVPASAMACMQLAASGLVCAYDVAQENGFKGDFWECMEEWIEYFREMIAKTRNVSSERINGMTDFDQQMRGFFGNKWK